MKVVYLDCFSGISGDMTLSALVDAGAKKEKIEQGLELLFHQPVKLNFDTVVKRGISAKKLSIRVGSVQVVEPVYVDTPGQVQIQHTHPHSHGHNHEHGVNHEHGHDHNHNTEGHRHYSEIVKMIQEAKFAKQVEQRALDVFKIIGLAEAKIHHIPLETVHFHEVGAVDSIVDIVGVAIALDDLGIERIFASPVAVGSGYVRCDHGLYPVPAPATLEMLKDIPIRFTEEKGELTTPTGAGFLSALVDQFTVLPPMTVREIGYGAGKKELEAQPNVLRVVIGELT